MVKDWEVIDRALRRVNFTFAALGGLALVICGTIVVFDVVMRYVFNDPTLWVQDAARFLLVYLVFFGLALTLQDRAHVSVDLFLEMQDEPRKWALRLVGGTLVVVFGIFLTWQTMAVTLDSIRLNWVSPSYLALPMKYVYVAGPLGSLLFTITAVLLVLRHATSRPSQRVPSDGPEI